MAVADDQFQQWKRTQGAPRGREARRAKRCANKLEARLGCHLRPLLARIWGLVKSTPYRCLLPSEEPYYSATATKSAATEAVGSEKVAQPATADKPQSPPASNQSSGGRWVRGIPEVPPDSAALRYPLIPNLGGPQRCASRLIRASSCPNTIREIARFQNVARAPEMRHDSAITRNGSW